MTGIAVSPKVPPRLIVAAALLWIGTPYHHQASRCGVGADCLGLLLGLWRQFAGAVPEPIGAYSPSWAESSQDDRLIEAARRHLTPLPPDAIRAGDVLLFRLSASCVAKHIGIVIAVDRMIHAHQGGGVTAATLTPWWRRRQAGAFRFPFNQAVI